MFFINSRLPVRLALVYSLMVRRLNKDKGSSRKWLGKQTGMNPVKTLNPIVDKLKTMGLVTVNNGKLWPLPPEGDAASLFYMSKREGSWWKRFSFYRFKLRTPDSQLTSTQNVIYWKLVSLVEQGKVWQTQKGIARLLGLSTSTVGTAITALEDFAFLKIGQRKKGGWFKFTTEYPPDRYSWFTEERKDQKISEELKTQKISEELKTQKISEEPKLPQEEEKQPELVPAVKPGMTDDGEYRLMAKLEDWDGNRDWRAKKWTETLYRLMDEDKSNQWLQTEFPVRASELLQQLWMDNLSRWEGGRVDVFMSWFIGVIGNCKRQHEMTGKVKTCAYIIVHTLEKELGGVRK